MPVAVVIPGRISGTLLLASFNAREFFPVFGEKFRCDGYGDAVAAAGVGAACVRARPNFSIR